MLFTMILKLCVSVIGVYSMAKHNVRLFRGGL